MRIQLVTIGLLASIFLFGCEEAPEKQAAEPAVSEPTSLVAIMQALGVDMSVIAEGIWREDYPSIREGAQGIANHPKVTDRERKLIQSALAGDFPEFVSIDQLVHRTALELTEVKPGSIGATLETYARLQQGCVSCHTSFRARVAAARKDTVD